MASPNILLILVDSARHDAYRVAGGAARAPAYERLAAEGVLARRAWATCPICHPSRASIVTGLYPYAHGMITNGPFAGGFPCAVQPHVPALPAILRNAGYRTAYAGQMHIVLPGWDDDRHQTTRDYMNWLRARGHAESAAPGHRRFLGGRVAYTTDETREGQFAARALDILDDLSRRKGPWFLQLDFDGPHPPCYVPAEHDTYDPATVPLPGNLADDLADRPDWVLRARARQRTAGRSERDWRELTASYLGCVTMIDALVGRVLERLDQHRMAENTVVVFTSDHATAVGSHAFAMHGGPTLYEDVLRVPLAFRWPAGLPAGLDLDASIQHVDLVPTLLDLAGLDPPGRFHGRSVAAALRGEGGRWRDESYHVYSGDGAGFFSVRALRHGPWKMVYTPYGGRELYDLWRDPEERRNLSGGPEGQRAERWLARRLLALMDRIQDPLRGHARSDLAP